MTEPSVINRQLLAIVNPRSGQKQALLRLQHLKETLSQHGFIVHTAVTQFPGHARTLASQIDPREFSCVCAVGGDGTVHEVADGLMLLPANHRIPLAILPAGTGNALALQLQIHSHTHTAQRILNHSTRPLDVIHVTAGKLSTHCINLVGWGAATDVNLLAEKLRWLGKSRYAAAALLQILRPPLRHARVQLDQLTIELPLHFVIACNTRFAGHRMLLAPLARTDDGLLDVLLLKPSSRWNLLRIFHHIADGSHLNLPNVELHRVKFLSVHSRTEDPLNLDGELIGQSPFSAHVVPAALQVLA